MQISILLLPLLGGYLFCQTCEWYKYSLSRRTGYDLFFMSAVAGLVLWLPCIAVFLPVALGFAYLPSVEASETLAAGNAIACLASCGLGRPIGKALNEGRKSLANWDRPNWIIWGGYGTAVFLLRVSRFFTGHPSRKVILCGIDAESEIRNQVVEEGDEVEQLLLEAYKEEKLVMATLDDGKVFLGYATSNMDPYGDRRYFRILKLVSGYRDETKDFVSKTKYTRALMENDILDEDGNLFRENAGDFHVAIPKNSVAYINLYNPQLAKYFEGTSLVLDAEEIGFTL